MTPLLLIRYGEIALKGKNRPFFEKRLLQNIKMALRGLEPYRVSFQRGRYFVSLAEENIFQARRRLQKVFGIVSISPVSTARLEMDDICQKALKILEQNYRSGISFKVNTRRANKLFPYQSPQISATVGAYLLENKPELKVDVHNPELLLNIEIREKEAYLYSEAFAGPGGLPVGVTGKGLLLLSSGIDSPVAGWMALKRGLQIEALHFHSPPFTGEGNINKVLDLCRVLAAYGGTIILHLASFTAIQKEIRLHCPEEMLITIMRRMMVRIAGRLASIRNAGALYTGESLGQVASQTLENISATNEVATLPVLRPLVGFDKEEIINIAKKIDTYPISIRPYEDCCTLFVPQHPITRPRLPELEKAENNFDHEKLIRDCLENIESRTITPHAGL
ncbi:MAG: tRNA uracil 4-sulfurtransferase ThiI [Dethiobacteria bacterium]|jgi:thiamine biosynthesis protein ThiI